MSNLVPCHSKDREETSSRGSTTSSIRSNSNHLVFREKIGTL